jgi:3-dehydroquinate dehydratase-2
MKILVLHGVNLNLLGRRDPEHYGSVTLDEINGELKKTADELGVEVECFQTNHEGEMTERIHKAFLDGDDAGIINAGAWTHYSYAIRDALAMLEVPAAEIHLSNIHAREEFRRHSCLADCVTGQIAGFGADGYLAALRAVVGYARRRGA